MFKGLVVITILAIASAIIYWLVIKNNMEDNFGHVTIGSKTFRVEVARTDYEKRKGLSGRSSLGRADGMLFVFDAPAIRQFNMKNMNFPLDFVWINDNQIVDLTTDAPPDTSTEEPGTIYESREATNYVLEFPAGTINKYALERGRLVKIEMPKVSN